MESSGDSWMYPYQRTPMGNPYIPLKSVAKGTTFQNKKLHLALEQKKLGRHPLHSLPTHPTI